MKTQHPDKVIARFRKFVTPGTEGCELWTGKPHTAKNPYGRFYMFGRTEFAHRAAWKLFKGPIPADLNVLHKCDTPLCVAIPHLFLGTHVDNAKDRHAKKRDAVGERNGKSKLTAAQVLEIRSLPYSYRMSQELALKYGVATGLIWQVWHRWIWKHI